MIDIIHSNTIEQLPANPLVKGLLKELCLYLANHIHGLRKIYIYGSQARGNWHEDSDTDILLVIDEEIESRYLKNGESIFGHVMDITLNFIQLHEENTEICLLSPRIFNKDIWELTKCNTINPLFVNNLKKEGVLLFERNL